MGWREHLEQLKVREELQIVQHVEEFRVGVKCLQHTHTVTVPCMQRSRRMNKSCLRYLSSTSPLSRISPHFTSRQSVSIWSSRQNRGGREEGDTNNEEIRTPSPLSLGLAPFWAFLEGENKMTHSFCTECQAG